MGGLALEHRLALAAIVNGLRDGGEISETTIEAIAKRLRDATAISDDYGHRDTSEALRKLADAIESGGSGK